MCSCGNSDAFTVKAFQAYRIVFKRGFVGFGKLAKVNLSVNDIIIGGLIEKRIVKVWYCCVYSV